MEDRERESFVSSNGDVYAVTEPDRVLRFLGNDPHCRATDAPSTGELGGIVWRPVIVGE